MSKVVQYVNENSVKDIVVSIKQRKDLNVQKVVEDLKKSRVEYGLKIQAIIEELLK